MPEKTVTTAAEAIAALHQDAVPLFNAKDVDALLELWTDDGVYLPPGEPALHGKDAIRGYYERFQGTVESLVSDEIEVAGDWAYERGSVTVLAPPASGEGAGPTRVSAKYLDIWRRQPDGSWKVARAIWNLDAPAG